MKTALIVRKGAFGDLLMASPIFKLVKEEGYHVTLATSDMGADVVRNNPYVDKLISYSFDQHWKPLDSEPWKIDGVPVKPGTPMPNNNDFDRVIDLGGSVEETLLPAEGINLLYGASHEERHEKCNVNYYDNTLKVGGYPDLKGLKPELYFTGNEHDYARKFRRKHKDKFLVIWSLSGSSFHKAYPYAEIVAQVFLERHPDAVICTVGGPLCELLEWESPNTINCVNKWTIRKSMLMTKYADLVIGTETGLLNAASCYDTPKIVLLSHSSEENLTKYWTNTQALHADVPCYPCHRLNYTKEACPLDDKLKDENGRSMDFPVCMTQLVPKQVMDAMEGVYNKWRSK